MKEVTPFTANFCGALNVLGLIHAMRISQAHRQDLTSTNRLVDKLGLVDFEGAGFHKFYSLSIQNQN